jgi:hypothetical protein
MVVNRPRGFQSDELPHDCANHEAASRAVFAPERVAKSEAES